MLGLSTETARTITLANLGLLITGLPFVLIALRIVALAKGDSAALTALTSTLNVQGAFFHVVTVLLPIYIAAFVAWVLFRPQKERVDRRGKRDPLETATIAVGVVLLGSVIPLDLLLVTAALIIGYVVSHAWDWVKGLMRWVSGAVVGVLLLGPVVLVSSGESMWLPAERITVRGGEQSVVYTLDSGGGAFLVLHYGSTRVERLLASSVISREVCRVGDLRDGTLNRSVLSLIIGKAMDRTPAC